MTNYQLIFPNTWTKYDQADMEIKGYCNRLKVQIGDRVYPVFFVEPNRILNEMETMKKHGELFWAETNTIVLERVTLATIIQCLDKLEDDFFDVDEKTRAERFIREELAASAPAETADN